MTAQGLHRHLVATDNHFHVGSAPKATTRPLDSRCRRGAINVRFASGRTAAKFASLFDEAGGGVRDVTEIDRTGEHA
jgi:hypothetical protein